MNFIYISQVCFCYLNIWIDFFSMQMLIGRYDFGNDVITLFTFRIGFRFALIGENLTAQSTGSHRE